MDSSLPTCSAPRHSRRRCYLAFLYGTDQHPSIVIYKDTGTRITYFGHALLERGAQLLQEMKEEFQSEDGEFQREDDEKRSIRFARREQKKAHKRARAIAKARRREEYKARALTRARREEFDFMDAMRQSFIEALGIYATGLHMWFELVRDAVVGTLAGDVEEMKRCSLTVTIMVILGLIAWLDARGCYANLEN